MAEDIEDLKELNRQTGFSINAPNLNLSNTVGAVSGLALATYLGFVLYNGNTGTLKNYLLQEEPYLEFIAAIAILWLLTKYGPSSQITDFLIVGVLLAMAFRIASRVNLPGVMQQFATGQVGLFKTISTLLQGI